MEWEWVGGTGIDAGGKGCPIEPVVILGTGGCGTPIDPEEAIFCIPG